VSDDRLEYAYEAARLQAAQRMSVVVDAFLSAIAERSDPEDIVALLEKMGWRLACGIDPPHLVRLPDKKTS